MKKTGRQFLVFLALLVLFAQVPCMNQRVSAAAKTTTEKKTTEKQPKRKMVFTKKEMVSSAIIRITKE